LALAALVQCWRRPPFSAFTSVVLVFTVLGFAVLQVWVYQRPPQPTARVQQR
jgi:hypothetical protein